MKGFEIAELISHVLKKITRIAAIGGGIGLDGIEVFDVDVLS